MLAVSRRKWVARDRASPELRVRAGPQSASGLPLAWPQRALSAARQHMVSDLWMPTSGQALMTACAGRAIIPWVGASVLIVDDHKGFRAWARMLLEQAGYTVLGEAADGASAIRAALRLRPRVVLLDVQLPDTDGFEVARRLGGERRSPAIVLISTRDAADYAGRLERSCAVGFLPKEDLTAEALALLLSAGDDGDPGSEPGAGG